MVLKIGEQKWHLHFHHEFLNDEGLSRRKRRSWDVVVTCLVHTGPCILTHASPKYCVNGRTGTALCSKKDNFVKSVGNRMALTEAIKHLPQEARRAIWEAYWMLTKRPKETSEQFRERKAQSQKAS